MPKTKLVLFRESDGGVPLLDWLDTLPKKPRAKCIARLQRLGLMVHELRRPESDFLRNGIYELRVGHRAINYRILYFFHGQVAAVVSHGTTKERRIPDREIDLAITRKKEFEEARQTYM